jgi:hypothetical protein
VLVERYRDRVTRTAPSPRTDGLTATLADLVCWFVFYLERCEEDETDLEVADELSQLIAATLRAMAAADRLRFLEHAAERAATATIPDYQDFLLELAEKMGLE